MMQVAGRIVVKVLAGIVFWTPPASREVLFSGNGFTGLVSMSWDPYNNTATLERMRGRCRLVL